MRLFSIALVILMLSGCQSPKAEQKTNSIELNKELQGELDSIVIIDQIAAGIPQGKYATWSKEAWQSFKDSVFRTHQDRALVILEEYGFPGVDLVGENGSKNYWLIVQHADHDPAFQQRILDSMEIQVARQNANPENFAYLTDRVRANTGRPQLYGTQMDYNFDICQAFPKNGLEDEELVNQRRKEMGMEPLEAYLNQVSELHFEMNKDYFLSQGIEGPALYEVPESP